MLTLVKGLLGAEGQFGPIGLRQTRQPGEVGELLRTTDRARDRIFKRAASLCIKADRMNLRHPGHDRAAEAVAMGDAADEPVRPKGFPMRPLHDGARTYAEMLERRAACDAPGGELLAAPEPGRRDECALLGA